MEQENLRRYEVHIESKPEGDVLVFRPVDMLTYPGQSPSGMEILATIAIETDGDSEPSPETFQEIVEVLCGLMNGMHTA